MKKIMKKVKCVCGGGYFSLKKVLSIILILTILIIPFQTLLNVNAEGVVITTNSANKVTNMANLTVNSEPSEDSFKAYKVVDAFYNNTTNEMSYQFTTEFNEFLESSGDEALVNLTIDNYMSYATGNSNDFKNLANKFAKAIKNGDYSFKTYNLEYSSSSATASVEVGSYLVLPTAINEYYSEFEAEVLLKTINSYDVLIANVVFTVNSGNWILNDCSVYSKTTPNYLGSAFLKTDAANFDDYITDFGPEKVFNDLEFEMGKKYLFYVFASESRMEPNDPIWKLEIAIPDGLKVTLDDIYFVDGELIKISDNKLTDSNGRVRANVTLDGQTITITSPNVTDLLGVCIEVTLADTSKIVIGNAGNVINTKLTYESDQYTDPVSTDYFEVQNKAITYGLEITNKNKENTYLADGIFGIYSDEECSEAKKIGQITIDQVNENKKYGRYIGLSSGTYYIKQLKASSGYKLSNDVAQISIDSNVSSYYSLEVTNAKMGLLPTTGGLGTILYTTFGLLIIVVGSIFFISYRKRQVNS